MWDHVRPPVGRFLKRWGPALGMMVVIFVGSSIPGDEFPQYNGVWDFIVKKSGHLLEYGLLALFMLRGVAGQPDNGQQPSLSQVLGTLALAMLYAASDEFHQRFTPGRGSHLLDVGIDLIGGSLALGLLRARQAIRQTRSRTPRSPSTPPPA